MVRDMALIGQRNTLTIVRASVPGLYLDGGAHGEGTARGEGHGGDGEGIFVKFFINQSMVVQINTNGFLS